MRTSGKHDDTLLYAVPFVVLLVVAVTRMGGLGNTARILNETVVDALHWLAGLI